MEHCFGYGSAERLSGVVGLEIYGRIARLRSLAVDRSSRGLGVGKALVSAAEAYAESRQVRELYLLTTGAERFFERLGYQRLEREAAPEPIRATSEFSSLCPTTSLLMRKELIPTSQRNGSGTRDGDLGVPLVTGAAGRPTEPNQ